MMSDLMREDFEIWWAANMNIQEMDLYRLNFPMQKPDFVQPYACHETQRSWLAWQSSRECLVIELPKPIEVEVVGVGCTLHSEYLDVEQVERCMESYGIKTK